MEMHCVQLHGGWPALPTLNWLNSTGRHCNGNIAAASVD